MKEIIIESDKYGPKVALIDDEDYEIVSKYNWSVAKSDTTFYAIYTLYNKGIQKTIRMHRLVTNAPAGVKVDHKDHNGLNNQKYNLRLCNTQQNNQNKYASRGSKSKYKGVSHRKNRWTAAIRHNGKCYCLGSFINEDDAARQYDYYALKLFGEFAHLNFPDYDYSTYIPQKTRTKDNRSSQYIGVYRDKHNNAWRSTIYVNKKNINIGYYKTEVDAAIGYNNYVIDNNLDKELNIIEDDNGTQEID